MRVVLRRTLFIASTVFPLAAYGVFWFGGGSITAMAAVTPPLASFANPSCGATNSTQQCRTLSGNPNGTQVCQADGTFTTCQ